MPQPCIRRRASTSQPPGPCPTTHGVRLTVYHASHLAMAFCALLLQDATGLCVLRRREVARHQTFLCRVGRIQRSATADLAMPMGHDRRTLLQTQQPSFLPVGSVGRTGTDVGAANESRLRLVPRVPDAQQFDRTLVDIPAGNRRRGPIVDRRTNVLHPSNH